MSALDVEIVELTGIDLEDTPPCDAVLWKNMQQCCRPSVARLHIQCHTCREDWYEFMCPEHVEQFRQGIMHCAMCDKTNITWGES